MGTATSFKEILPSSLLRAQYEYSIQQGKANSIESNAYDQQCSDLTQKSKPLSNQLLFLSAETEVYGEQVPWEDFLKC